MLDSEYSVIKSDIIKSLTVYQIKGHKEYNNLQTKTVLKPLQWPKQIGQGVKISYFRIRSCCVSKGLKGRLYNKLLATTMPLGPFSGLSGWDKGPKI